MSYLILASASPRRKQLLHQMGLSFDVVPSEVNENILERLPTKYAEQVALKKNLPVSLSHPHKTVLSADTIVVAEGQILGKPSSHREACAMLTKLSGQVHDVITGIAVVRMRDQKQVIAHKLTKVQFKKLSQTTIMGYIQTGEPMDKAGAYGIQGFGACLVERIEGCYFNVVGLPISLLADLLPEFDITIW